MPIISKSSMDLWYKMDGDANDSSGNSNNGTVSGATLTTDQWGRANKAYDFDGVDDKIDTGIASLSRPKCVILAFSADNPSDSDFPHILANWNDSSQDFFMRTTTSSSLEIRFDAATSQRFVLTNTLASGEYKAFAMNIDSSSNAEFFLDGVMEDSGTLQQASYDSGGNIHLGNTAGASSQDFDGKIQEFAIMNKKLSKAKLMFDYANRNITRSLIN